MISPSKIQKHMDVVSSKSEPLGMVDHVAGTESQAGARRRGPTHGAAPASPSSVSPALLNASRQRWRASTPSSLNRRR